MQNRQHTVNELLGRLDQHQDRVEALNDLVPLVYDELRSLAHRQLQREGPACRLQTTSLVHETYLKLTGLNEISWECRTQILSIASLAMRRLLIDLARKRLASKRGGKLETVEFNEEMHFHEDGAEGIIVLDAALSDLESIDERQCRVVEYRFFGGLNFKEIGAILGISDTTARRDWRFAKAWLKIRIAA